MSAFITELQDDLKSRLRALCWMHDLPGQFVNDHFAQIRREIDSDAESALSHLKEHRVDKSKEIETLNEQWKRFIEFLNEAETGLMMKISGSSWSSAEMYQSLKTKIDQFEETAPDHEEAYEQLVWELMKETNRMEKTILGNQTIFYFQVREVGKLGTLVRLPPYETLSGHEIFALK